MIWDWIIVGSGFGGSVSALRLAEKGYSVLVLEKGQRWEAEDYPRTNWNLKKWLWLPGLGCRGFFKMTFFRHLTALSGVGVGGGSLVYANTLPVPGKDFFAAPGWGHLADWKTELEPHYATAQQMLGATETPIVTPQDRALKAVAEKAGIGERLGPAPVAVYFGKANVTVPDPYFEGRGPERTGCNLCGGCMTGCRYGSKNTLDQNYLWLAEGQGATIHADTEVTWIRPLEGERDSSHQGSGSGFEISARERISAFRRKSLSLRAKNVILAGGALGTGELLGRLKESSKGLPLLSERVGDRVRTNSEVLMAVTSGRKDLEMSEGVAITSFLRTDDQSALEPCRFGRGSGFLRLLGTPHASGRTLWARLSSSGRRLLASPVRSLQALLVRDWARRTAVLLYMRTHEGFIRLKPGRKLTALFRRGLTSAPGEGPLPTAHIPEATALGESFAQEVDGYLGSLLTETLFGIPTTAHILGGACMGSSAEDGVIDHQHRVFGYPGLYVVDGSAVSANPGVNPSLTITALSERAMSFIPEKNTEEGP